MAAVSFSSKMAPTTKVPFDLVKPKAKADTFLTTVASMKAKSETTKPTEKGHISIPFKIMNT